MNHNEINPEITNQAATHANVLVCSYTYNHDLPHPAFLERKGFVRASIQYQGMVGKPIDKGTRLTWLVNMNMGSVVPSAFTGALVNSRESISDWRAVFGARNHRSCRSLGGLLHLSLSLPRPLLSSLALPPSLSPSLPPSLTLSLSISISPFLSPYLPPSLPGAHAPAQSCSTQGSKK